MEVKKNAVSPSVGKKKKIWEKGKNVNETKV